MFKRVLSILMALGLLLAAVNAQAEIERITEAPLTLSYWIPLGDKASQSVTSNAEIPIYDVLEEKTGVSIEWLHPSTTDVATQLNLMIASQELPDLIFFNWNSFSGGLSKALSDRFILPLNDWIDQSAPNYKKLLEENPELAKQVTLDDGTLAVFPSARTDMSVRVWFGPQIRQDWLDRLGLQIPETMDQWHDVLTAFRDQDANGNGDPNDEIPFVAAGATSLASYLLSFSGAFGQVRMSFCLNDGKVVYSPIQPGYKDFLQTMAQWYAEGLIDPDFAATDGTGVKSLVTSDQAGAYFGSLAGNLGGYNAALQAAYPEGQIVGTPWPSGPAGVAYQTESEHIKAFGGNGAVVTTACKNVEAAVKWLDAHYSDEGSLLMNFGIEGVSYTMVDGYPTFTDAIFNDPSGLSYDLALAKYSMAANTTEVMVQDPREFAQFSLRTEYQKQANKLWGAGDTSLLLPAVLLTTDESAEYSKIMSEVGTYATEQIVKYIMGQESLDNFDAFVANVEKMGVSRATEIQQAAYDRYMQR